MMKKNLLLIFFLLFASQIFTSCGHIQSGQYVQLEEGMNLETIAAVFNVEVSEIKKANPNKKIRAGEWIFVPLEDGILMKLRSIDPGAEYEIADIPGKFLWPVPSSKTISSPYGERWGAQHGGIDIAATEGSNIVAADSGEVVYSGDEIKGYGNMVIIRHPYGVFTAYAHAKKLYADKGDRVARGQVIALVGSTGRSTGPHLHFEVRRNNIAINPMPYLPEKASRFLASSSK